MKYILGNKFNFIIVLVFMIWLILELFSLVDHNYFIVELAFSIVLVILFDFAYKNAINVKARNRSILYTIHLFFALLLAPITVTHFNGIDFNTNEIMIVIICISLQSVIYLLHSAKKQ